MTIKITPTSTPNITPARPSSVRAGAGFSLSETASAKQAGGATGTQTSVAVMGMETLLALQAEAPDQQSEKKRRQVRRAGGLLDALDQLKIELLDGHLTEGAVSQLKHRMQQAREDVGDPGLEDLLNHIETRAMVELAKRGRA